MADETKRPTTWDVRKALAEAERDDRRALAVYGSGPDTAPGYEMALEVAEHRDALVSEVVTIVRELGGEVEGLPTQTINYLQRIRALRAIEADRDILAAEVERLRKAMGKRCAAGHNDTCAAMLGDYACSCGHDDLLRGLVDEEEEEDLPTIGGHRGRGKALP